MVDQMQGIPLTILYDWMNDGTDQTNLEHNFGLVQSYNTSNPDSRLVPLPAFYAIRTLTTVLDGLSYAGRFDTGDPSDYAVKFSNHSRTVWACWNAAAKAHQVTLPLGASVKLTRTTYDGSSVTPLTSGPDGYACTTSEAPEYLTVGDSGLVRKLQH
jgi:hypothetical protein